MGITISLLNVRRSILIQASPAKVWQEFGSFERFAAWFGRGHELHLFEPKLGSLVDLSVVIDAEERHFGGPIVVWEPEREVTFESKPSGSERRDSRPIVVWEPEREVTFESNWAGVHAFPVLLHASSYAPVRRNHGRDHPPWVRAPGPRCSRVFGGLRRRLGCQAPQGSAVDRRAAGTRRQRSLTDPEILSLLRNREVLNAGEIAANSFANCLNNCAFLLDRLWREDCSCEPDLNAAASRQTLRVVGFGRATADAVDQTWSSYRPPLHLRGATTPHRTERVGIQTP